MVVLIVKMLVHKFIDELKEGMVIINTYDEIKKNIPKHFNP